MRLGHFNFFFPRDYEVKALESYSLAPREEQLYQFPTQLDEGDRTGVYVRVVPKEGSPWIGFFALGFDSEKVANGIYSCPAPNSLCVAAGGYAYIVHAGNPQEWVQVEQRPVVEIRALPDLKLLLFTGFTSITAFGTQGHLWTTERLSWEGITVSGIQGEILHGQGWDAMADKEVPFEVDLLTGKSTGGARPGEKQNL